MRCGARSEIGYALRRSAVEIGCAMRTRAVPDSDRVPATLGGGRMRGAAAAQLPRALGPD
eukprot:3695566-Rhodomonas_salina.2